MGNMNMEHLVIQNSSGRDVTTSLIVAQVFGKEHKNVCRDIENLSCSESFNRLNFERITYKDARNREQTAYEMTKDGFSFLVMGYTGEKAGQFKEAFINEFNKREMMLKSDDYILARSQEILHHRLQIAEQRLQIAEAERDHYQKEVKVLAPKAEYTDAVLQSTSTFTFTQIAHDLGMRSVRVLMDELKSRKMIYRQSDQWQPTAKVADKGYFATRTAKYIKSDGSIGTSISTVVTESGRMFLRNLLKKQSYETTNS